MTKDRGCEGDSSTLRSVVQQQGGTFDVSLPEFAEGQGLYRLREGDR